jgi:hypothetical protein
MVGHRGEAMVQVVEFLFVQAEAHLLGALVKRVPALCLPSTSLPSGTPTVRGSIISCGFF